MNGSLEKEIKAEIAYTEEVKRCDRCRYYAEVESLYVDRMWHSKCNYVKDLGSINVKPDASCSNFEPSQEL